MSFPDKYVKAAAKLNTRIKRHETEGQAELGPSAACNMAWMRNLK
jgi:hypothetical protein